MYTLVLDKTLNPILPSCVGCGDYHNDCSPTSSSGRGSSNVQSLQQETLPMLLCKAQKVRYFLMLKHHTFLLNLIISLGTKAIWWHLGDVFTY